MAHSGLSNLQLITIPTPSSVPEPPAKSNSRALIRRDEAGAPGKTLGRLYTFIGFKVGSLVNGFAQQHGKGPGAAADTIVEFLGQEQWKEESVTDLHSRKQIPVEVLKACSKLVKFAFRSQTPKTQYTAFRNLVILSTQFPGLKVVFMESDHISSCPAMTRESQNNLFRLWDRPDDSNCDSQWHFFCEFAAACLTDHTIFVLIKGHRARKLSSAVAHTSGLSFIENLLNVSVYDAKAPFSSHLSIRYLGSILNFNHFWEQLCLEYSVEATAEGGQLHSGIADKLLKRAVLLLQDLGIDESGKEKGPLLLDEEGVDKYCEAILLGLQSFLQQLPAHSSIIHELWYNNLESVIWLLRQPKARTLLPNSQEISLNTIYARHWAFSIKEQEVVVEADGISIEGDRMSASNTSVQSREKKSAQHAPSSPQPSFTEQQRDVSLDTPSTPALSDMALVDESKRTNETPAPGINQMASQSQLPLSPTATIFGTSESTNNQSSGDSESHENNQLAQFKSKSYDLLDPALNPVIASSTVNPPDAALTQNKETDEDTATSASQALRPPSATVMSYVATDDHALTDPGVEERRTERDIDTWKVDEQALEESIMLLGSEHPDTVQAMVNLAATYHNLGQYTEAEKLEQQVLEKRTELLGTEHPDTVQAMANLAATYSRLGWYIEAEKLKEQVLEKRTKLLGTEHPDTIRAMANLAVANRNLGRYTEAERLEKQVLAKRTQLLSVEHPDIMEAMANLAATYGHLGQYTEAERLEEQVLEKRTQLLGTEHPDTMQAMANLAATYHNWGRYTEAEKLEQVLEKRTSLLGAEHPETLQAMDNLAATYHRLGQYTKAERLEEQVLEWQTRLLGTEHPDTMRAMANLAATYQDLGQYTEAERLEEQVLEWRTRLLGTEHPDTMQAMASLAGTYSSLGRYTDAQNLEEKVLEQRTRLLGVEHPHTIEAMANLAGTYSSWGQYTDAQKLMEKVLEDRTRLLGSEHPDTIQAMTNLAQNAVKR